MFIANSTIEKPSPRGDDIQGEAKTGDWPQLRGTGGSKDDVFIAWSRPTEIARKIFQP